MGRGMDEWITGSTPLNIHFTHTHIFQSQHRLSTTPTTLDDLGESLDLLDKLQREMSSKDKEFEPLHDQFNMLEKYEVEIPEEVSKLFYSTCTVPDIIELYTITVQMYFHWIQY